MVDFCCLLITFANGLDPDQAQQNVGPDLDPNCFSLFDTQMLLKNSSIQIVKFSTRNNKSNI